MPVSPRPLFPDRDPYLQTAIARQRIEFFVIALEIRRIGSGQAGRRQPVIPDRIDGAPNGGDVVLVRENSISRFRNPDAAEFARQIGKIRDLDAGDIVEISGIVAVAADAVGDLADPVGDLCNLLAEALPLTGNGGAALPGVTLADTGDEKGFSGFKARRRKFVDDGGIHDDRLL